ncbi:MAG: type II secretion system protein GspD [Sedimentisphaeraceae bacterium JB056]
MRKLAVVLLLGVTLSMAASTEGDHQKNKQNVINQLEQLFQPEPIKPRIVLDDEEPYLKVVAGSSGNSTLIYMCRYSDCKEVSDGLEAVISRNGLIEEAEDKNMVVVSDTDEKIEEIRQVIVAMDVPVPQILVEAKVIEVYTTDQYDQELMFDYNQNSDTLGVGANAYGGGVDIDKLSKSDMFNFSPYSLGVSGQINNFGFFFDWLKTANNAQILSSPNVVVSLGSQGNIVTGDDLPIQSTSTTGSTVNTDIKYKRTGITLDVSPVRINKNTVKLKVNPQVSTVTRYEKFNELNIPVVSIRDVETELTVRNGEIIMLGGLYSTEELTEEKKVPLLSDLPLLGELFKSRNDTTQIKQLIFFMKVNIVENSASTFVDVEDNASKMRSAGETIKASKQLFPGDDDSQDKGE